MSSTGHAAGSRRCWGARPPWASAGAPPRATPGDSAAGPEGRTAPPHTAPALRGMSSAARPCGHRRQPGRLLFVDIYVLAHGEGALPGVPGAAGGDLIGIRGLFCVVVLI